MHVVWSILWALDSSRTEVLILRPADPSQPRVSCWRLRERFWENRDRGLTNLRDPFFLLYTAASQWTKIQLISIWKVGCKYFFSKAGCVYKLCWCRKFSFRLCWWLLPVVAGSSSSPGTVLQSKFWWHKVRWKFLWPVASQDLHGELLGRQLC